nr:carbamoyltransferase HypF [Marinisporobacter balticus]
MRKYIIVKGIVQGVGFRPFIYKMALENHLNGYVKNTSKGVCIDIEGKIRDIYHFIDHLKQNPPKLANIDKMNIEDKKILNYKSFEIKHSDEEANGFTFISPDIGTCEDCLRDIKNNKDRRYRYPFTNCTNCGPRFSIVKKLPYDRILTTMERFEMCDLCKDEYKNPLDRRLHAQPNACPNCGPKIVLIDTFGNKIICNDPIKQTIQFMKQGMILGIKGLGGFHLACDAKNKEVIQILRNRKHRPNKPFALMMKDINTVKKYCYLSEEEEKVILSNKRPILLLNKRKEKLPDNIAPSGNKLGVMLPYTPLHYLLFEEKIEVLVMTSANVSKLPMVYKNEEALEKLKGIVDYLMLHDREIYMPMDDSVSRVILSEQRVIRSARGYSPIFMRFKNIKDIFACGSHFNNTFALSKNENVFISPYIGDIENVETYNHFEKNVYHIKNIYSINPKIIAYDMHPNDWSSSYVNKQNIEKIPVQHHHAHIVSCMVENKIEDKIIGIAYDGTGYGTDGNVWGGEFLICDYKEFERVAHINEVDMPGGDAATKEPWKMAISYIYKTYKNNIYENIPLGLKDKNIKVIVAIIKNNINSPKCSSMGRFFDAVSALIGFKGKVTFEGEAAILLENKADQNEAGTYDYDIEYINRTHRVNTDKIIKGIIEDINQHISDARIAKKFHNTVIDFSVKICGIIGQKHHINKVALSGGVFQNEILLKGIYEKLVSKGFEVYIHKYIPCNDSGISLGQLVVASSKAKG